jgi:hypothetical protein
MGRIRNGASKIMKALILATIAILVYSLAMTAVFRLVRVKFRAAAMMRLFVVSMPFFIATLMLTPADLGVLPDWLVEPYWWVELPFGVLLYAAAFMGGILQLYNLADRGFSLRIVIDVDAAREHPPTCDEIYRGYSAGRGLPWMYQKRIDGMLENGLVEVRDGTIRTTRKGEQAAGLFAGLRGFLSLDAGPSASAVEVRPSLDHPTKTHDAETAPRGTLPVRQTANL